MNVTRLQVDTALFNLLVSCYAWQYTSMYYQNWSDVQQQPAMFLRRSGEVVTQVGGYSANKYELQYLCIFLVKIDNASLADPYPVIDPIMDAIDRAVLGTPGLQNTLGGLIANVRIAGQIFIDDGVADGQAIVGIPISVFTGTN